MYCSGLDKADNNACFICIKHIRLQALERLMSPDFEACKSNETWCLPTAILDQVSSELTTILPECPPPFQALPYLMATFKQHKSKYRWLTNAFQTIFSSIATLLTLTSAEILETYKSWANSLEIGYKNFLKVDTSMFSIDSAVDATLNFPDQIFDIFVADITRCYESIPLQGEDNLLDAIQFIVNKAFRQQKKLHPKSNTLMWVRTDQTGFPQAAKWSASRPNSGSWFSISEQRLLVLHEWLMKNCKVMLGNRVWTQRSGIPMGFSCSPMWCNLYLLAYESQFIMRLAKLQRPDLMRKFKNAYRYIDDLCLINVTCPREFLLPSQPRTDSNPWWIYPLHVLEIKEETSRSTSDYPTGFTVAHFMNVAVTIHDPDSGKFSFTKFDKRRTLPFQYTQYIKFRSNRSVHQAYNIAISQLVPILYITSTNEAACLEIKQLLDTLMGNGFNHTRLLRISTQFLHRSCFPGSKLDIAKMIPLITAMYRNRPS